MLDIKWNYLQTNPRRYSRGFNFLGLGLSFFIAIFPLRSFAQDNSQAEKILYFDSNIAINKDASIDVTELITVNATQNKIKHGIVRRLPIQLIDDHGVLSRAQYLIQQVLINNVATVFRTVKSNNKLEIYIGKDNKILPPGIYTYTLQYHVDHAVSFLKDTDEFYWNITGGTGDFPIIKAEADIRLPDNAHVLSYSGYTGTSERKEKYFYAREEAQNHIAFVTTQPLKRGAGFEIAVAWPKGVTVASKRKKGWKIWKNFY